MKHIEKLSQLILCWVKFTVNYCLTMAPMEWREPFFGSEAVIMRYQDWIIPSITWILFSCYFYATSPFSRLLRFSFGLKFGLIPRYSITRIILKPFFAHCLYPVEIQMLIYLVKDHVQKGSVEIEIFTSCIIGHSHSH